MENKIIKIPHIERIIIEDYGVIKKADIKFSPGLNIITGMNASGKTTVVRYLAEVFVNHLSVGEKEVFQIEDILNESTILIDDNLNGLSNELLIKVLKKLAASKRQVIVTLISSRFQEIKTKIKANIIDSKNFELKNK